MMKKLFSFTLLCFLFFSQTLTADAHFLATDKNIGSILHVDPNDEPLVGSVSSFFFDLKDKQGKFQAKNCYCRVDISENGTVIYSDAVFQENKNLNLNTTALFFTFPKIDVYTITLIGKPKTNNAFQPFTLAWNFRVDQQAPLKNNADNTHFFSKYLIHTILVGTIIIGILTYFSKGGERKNNEKNSSNIY